MSSLPEDIQTFLSLHHRASELSQAERAQYEALRARVQAAMQQSPPSTEDASADEPLF